MTKINSLKLFALVTIVALTGLLLGCNHDSGKVFLTKETTLYLIEEGQTIKAVDADNEPIDFTIDGSWYLISGKEVEKLSLKIYELREKALVQP